jgi:hypothetical protein
MSRSSISWASRTALNARRRRSMATAWGDGGGAARGRTIGSTIRDPGGDERAPPDGLPSAFVHRGQIDLRSKFSARSNRRSANAARRPVPEPDARGHDARSVRPGTQWKASLGYHDRGGTVLSPGRPVAGRTQARPRPIDRYGESTCASPDHGAVRDADESRPRGPSTHSDRRSSAVPRRMMRSCPGRWRSLPGRGTVRWLASVSHDWGRASARARPLLPAPSNSPGPSACR